MNTENARGHGKPEGNDNYYLALADIARHKDVNELDEVACSLS